MTVRRFLACVLITACAITAQAFRFEPISQDFAPSGPGATHVFRVFNSGTERIAVRVMVRPRTIEPDGTEIQGPESDRFLVYPRQMLLAPDEGRSVRIRWQGPDTVESELSFRVIAEQLPVDFGGTRPAEGAGIRLTYRYEGSLYVVPPGAAPELRISRAEVVERDGRQLLHMVIENRGTRRSLIHQPRVTVAAARGGSTAHVLETDALSGMAGENMLAASVREFMVPAPPGLPNGQVDARLEYTARH